MPSAEETTYLFKVMPETTQEFITRDVDLLVSQIKENLRLSSLKAKSSISHKHRPSPYHIPSRSWAEPGNCEICGTKNNNGTTQEQRHHHLHNHKTNTATRDDDPYELLQELLREGGLIKEAVKRLRTNFDDYENSGDEMADEEDGDDDVGESIIERQRRRKLQQQHRVTTGYRRKPYFYDSEDDPLAPVYEPLDL
ncbi:GSK-3-binding protein-like [Venturia canescens]|uniref:GSK-3-binding protein-like n=1 Tax=Venturia canescens TaxID=32260 RepID=UPI001C9BD594|nr:GSK-3-binding protein-like [Venturia canescens]